MICGAYDLFERVVLATAGLTGLSTIASVSRRHGIEEPTHALSWRTVVRFLSLHGLAQLSGAAGLLPSRSFQQVGKPAWTRDLGPS